MALPFYYPTFDFCNIGMNFKPKPFPGITILGELFAVNYKYDMANMRNAARVQCRVLNSG